MAYQPSRRERLQVTFVFLVFFGGVMFLVSPHPTRAQTIFRLSLVAIGVAGVTWLGVRQRRR